MNREFKVRHNEALHILSLLTNEAERIGEDLVFLGGSAVQAVLKNPKRLSIDLDVYYSGDTGALTKALEQSRYINTMRKSRSPEMFEFYSARKNDVLVKVDFLKIMVPRKYIFKKEIDDPGRGKFRTQVGAPEYLMAAKLSALAIGTIGRREESVRLEIDVVKDVFDLNSLFDEFPGLDSKTGDAFLEIAEQQNKLRKTEYGMQEIHASIGKTLKAIARFGKESLVTQGTLQNFPQYLYSGEVGRAGFVTMSMRALYHASAIQRKESAERGEEAVKKEEDREYVSAYEKALAESGEDPMVLHELKIKAPKALIYLYCSKFPETNQD